MYKAILGWVCGALVLSPITADEKINMDKLDEVTVTATREAQSIHDSTHSSGRVDGDEVQQVKPAHPSEVMGRIPGAHVNVTSGEGHMSAIRQPLTTRPVYLYLEDGIPIRSTGFFNHNALYEVNLPQASQIEVMKGPGSALYGSDAIGGVINIETRPTPLEPEVSVDLEAGEHGWRRLLLSAGTGKEMDGYRADVNLTHTDGWRENTEYDRQSVNGRWDRILESGAALKTVLAYSNIDQQTAGSSRLSETDYLNNPTENYTPISYRRVEALRLSMDYSKESSDTLTSVIPYFRSNSMELMPNWSFSFDPSIWDTKNDSVGLLLKHRMDFSPMQTRVIVGADLDYSPGSRVDYSIDATQTGDIYDSYTVTTKLYDYDVTFSGISPYVHGEFSPSEKTRVTLGLRYDDLRYDYNNKMSDDDIVINPASTSFPLTYKHVSDTTVDFSRLSPKLGLTYRFNRKHSGFAAYREAFRVPSEGQLFRPGRTINSENLKPVKVQSIETGIRGEWNGWKYDLALYNMRKRDDIVTYEYPNKTRETMNAGETLHRGIETGLSGELAKDVSLNIAASYAKHSYEEWRPNSTTDYSGNEISDAPRLIVNTRLGYVAPVLNGGKVELEWTRLGSYWLDDANTEKYSGHSLFNLRASYPVNDELKLYGRIMNLLDERYATTASLGRDGREFAPGMPRTAYLGMSYSF